MLISKEYVEQNKALHAARPDYGANGHRFAPVSLDMIRAVGARSFLDYGCGKGTLKPALFKLLLESGASPCPALREYDPAIQGKDARPEPADVVLCNDVLEHVEPECIDDVLADLARVVKRVGMLIVATRPAVKTLPDGRNAHLIQRPWVWWAEKLDRHFSVRSMLNLGGEVHFAVEPKGADHAAALNAHNGVAGEGVAR